MTDQHDTTPAEGSATESTEDAEQRTPLAPEADRTLLERSQRTIDEAKADAHIGVEESEDEQLADEGVPVAGDSEPADGPAPGA